MILDTCFLIDLQREYAADREGPARTFLKRYPSDSGRLSVGRSVLQAPRSDQFDDGSLA